MVFQDFAKIGDKEVAYILLFHTIIHPIAVCMNVYLCTYCG